jgi:hypothetical protein
MEGEIQFCSKRAEETKRLNDGRGKGACSEARLFVSAKGWDLESCEWGIFSWPTHYCLFPHTIQILTRPTIQCSLAIITKTPVLPRPQ